MRIIITLEGKSGVIYEIEDYLNGEYVLVSNYGGRLNVSREIARYEAKELIRGFLKNKFANVSVWQAREDGYDYGYFLYSGGKAYDKEDNKQFREWLKNW